MAEKIRKCMACKIYTLCELCPKCGNKAESPRPPKFSPDDKYGVYRREVKKQELIQKDLY